MAEEIVLAQNIQRRLILQILVVKHPEHLDPALDCTEILRFEISRFKFVHVDCRACSNNILSSEKREHFGVLDLLGWLEDQLKSRIMLGAVVEQVL